MSQFVIDRVSADVILKIIRSKDSEHAFAGVVIEDALAMVLERKIAGDESEITCGGLAERFALFFQQAFAVGPEEIPVTTDEFIVMIDRAISGLEKSITVPNVFDEDENDYAEMIAMYQADLEDFRKIKELTMGGYIKEAVAHWQSLDTAPRGRIFGRTENEEYQLGLFLNQYGR